MFIHLLKLRLHQVLYVIHFFNNPLVGFIVAVKELRIPSSSLFESSSGLVSLKVVASALLFPMVLRYAGHSYFMCLKPWPPKNFGLEGTVY